MSEQVGQHDQDVPIPADRKTCFEVAWQGGTKRQFYPESMKVRGADGAIQFIYNAGKNKVIVYPQLLLYVEQMDVTPPPPKPKNDVVSDRG